MKIDEKGYSLSTADEILSAYEKQLQQKFGSDFYIKPEGVIDNIVNSSGVMEIDLQEQIASLAKQFDPEASEDNWQDALYERIGVSRLDEQATVFKKKILGTAGYAGAAGAVTIRSKSTNDEFENTSNFTIEDDGTAEIEFECVVAGAVSVNASDSFVIVEGPNEVTGISADDAVQIAIGRERESDSDFRLRFRNSKAQNARATRNANEANLLKYVDNIAFLKIIDKKTDNSFDAGTIKIIAKKMNVLFRELITVKEKEKNAMYEEKLKLFQYGLRRVKESYRADIWELLMMTLLNENKDILKVLSHPSIKLEERKNILRTSFQDYVNEEFLHFLFVLIDNFRLEEISDMLDSYEYYLNLSNNICNAIVYSKYQMLEEEKMALQKALESHFNKKINLKYQLNVNLLGGIIVNINGKVIDASTLRQIIHLKNELKKGW